MAWLLGAAAIGLFVLIAVITAMISGSKAPLCDPQFPARIGAVPSWVYVFVAIAAFALGHGVGQVGIRQQKRSVHELGEAEYDGRPAAAVNAGVAIFLLLVTFALGIEAWTLGHGVWPITYYTRCSTDASAWVALLGSSTYAFVIGRWMWVLAK